MTKVIWVPVHGTGMYFAVQKVARDIILYAADSTPDGRRKRGSERQVTSAPSPEVLAKINRCFGLNFTRADFKN